MFKELEDINKRPVPFEFYTASDLWTDEYTSEQMLRLHLSKDIDAASRKEEFIERSVEWIASRFSLGAGTKIADFGCGPGLYAIRLARKKTDVTGIDFSSRSIRYAREAAKREGLSINYINGNYLEFETNERFDLILMIMCDFCALGPEQRKQLLCRFNEILEPDGSVLLDAYSLKAFDMWEEKAIYEAGLLNGFWSANKYYGFLNTFKYQREKVALDKYTIIEPERTRTVYNWFQCFSRETIEGEFEECGFVVEGFYSDVAGTSYDPESKEFAVIARRKK